MQFYGISCFVSRCPAKKPAARIIAAHSARGKYCKKDFFRRSKKIIDFLINFNILP